MLVGRQVGMSVRQLDSLATLPGTLASILASVERPNTRSVIGEIVNFDPAMTAAFLSRQSRASQSNSIDSIVASMSSTNIKTVALGVPVYQQFDESNGVELEVLPYSQLVLHSLATACASEMIAEICLGAELRQLAYTAGLLHDIGKLAVYQVMPKSFERVAELALLNSHASIVEENENLGVNHTTLGKMLAEKWHLPDLVGKAIWLHHTDTTAILEDVETNRFLSVVALADVLARKTGVGHSGSFNKAVVDEGVLSFLGLGRDQVEEIGEKLSAIVGERDDRLGINAFSAQAELPRILQDCAAEESAKNSALLEKNSGLVVASMQADFIQQFVSDLPSSVMPAVTIASSAVALWQEHFQIDGLSMYYYCQDGKNSVEVVTIDEGNRIKNFARQVKGDEPAVPAEIQKRFDVIDVRGTWVQGQSDIVNNIVRARMLPLIVENEAIGAIVFVERESAISQEQQKLLFEIPAGVVAAMLGQALACSSNTTMAERFVSLLSNPEAGRMSAESSEAFDAVAEMAAGAAHELNNPLAVISGRTQLLADAETDPDKKRDLEQIHKRADEASRIVVQLMNYAKPNMPRASAVAVKDIVRAGCELVMVAKQIEEPMVTYSGIDGLAEVFVDGDQMMPVFAAIIANAVESYDEGNGPIEITSNCPQKEGMAGVLIKDFGRGMDSLSAEKATTPFFSAMPAGRKRGMGLANAQRLITLNKGLLKISSIPGKGTTVRVDLPLA